MALAKTQINPNKPKELDVASLEADIIKEAGLDGKGILTPKEVNGEIHGQVLAVWEPYRRTGIGSQVMEKLCEYARLHNTPIRIEAGGVPGADLDKLTSLVPRVWF